MIRKLDIMQLLKLLEYRITLSDSLSKSKNVLLSEFGNKILDRYLTQYLYKNSTSNFRINCLTRRNVLDKW